MRVVLKRPSVLPGFGLAMGVTVLYLSLIVLIPLSAAVLKAASVSWGQFWATVTSPRVMASYRLTFGASLVGALVNVVFGVLAAWVLTRCRFPGRRLVDALVDLPFALPTAVAGIALTAVFSGNGWIGRHLELLGIKAAFSPLGVVIAQKSVGERRAARERRQRPSGSYNLTHLQQLEAESIHIIREVAAEFQNPVMLYSIGKDSTTTARSTRGNRSVSSRCPTGRSWTSGSTSTASRSRSSRSTSPRGAPWSGGMAP
jgi:hypothetical protein